MAESLNPLSPSSAIDLTPLRAKWGWIVALGVIYLIAGLIALGSILTATLVSVFIVGVMMIIAGVAEVINSFQFKNWGKFLFWLLIGVLYIIGGFSAFSNPLLVAAFLTLVLGFSLIISGIMRLVLAFSVKAESSWVWVALSAVITLVLGVLILVRWPISSLYILGLFLAVDLVFTGAGWIGLGFGLHRHDDTRERGLQKA